MGRVIVATLCFAMTFACTDAETPRELTGVVVEIDSEGLTEVSSFMLRSGGETYEIFVDDDTDLAFSPSHLHEHRTTAEPVVVELEERDGRLYAVWIDDA